MQAPARALYIVNCLRQNGYQAYFCGGCVRDFLLKRKPKDYDIATNATCDEIKKLFKRTILVGAKFGVVKILVDEDIFEVATFRQDGNYQDGRHPTSVKFGDEKEDALRRDFTINGMFYDPIKLQIVDYVQGQQDLQFRMIRTIGRAQERFGEDYLRILRAIRFACQLNFSIENHTWQAIEELSNNIRKVSSERIRDELIYTMLSPYPARAWYLLYRSKILSFVFPSLHNLYTSHPESLRQTLLILEVGSPIQNFDLAVAMILNPLQKYDKINNKDLEIIIQQLCLPKKNNNYILELLKYYPNLEQVISMKIAILKRFLRISSIEDILKLYHCVCLTQDGSWDIYDFCIQKLRQWRDQLHPHSLVNGQDLMQLGFSSGPLFQKILLSVEDQQLEGNIQSHSEAMEWIKQHFTEGLERGK